MRFQMSVREAVEKNLAIWAGGLLVAGFLGGIGTITFLEAREDKLRKQIIEELRRENTNLRSAQDQTVTQLQDLKQQNEKLLEEAKDLLAQTIERQLEQAGTATDSDDQEIRSAIDRAIELDGPDAISAIARDPAKELRIPWIKF